MAVLPPLYSALSDASVAVVAAAENEDHPGQ